MSRYPQGDRMQATQSYRAALARARRDNDDRGIAEASMGLAMAALYFDLDADGARRHYEEAIEPARRSGDRKLLAIALGRLGESCQFGADYDAALQYAGEAAKIFTELRMTGSVGVQYVDIAHVHTLRREYPAALEFMRRAREAIWTEAHPRRIAFYLELCATYLVARHRLDDATRVLAFIERYRREHDEPRPGLPPWLANNIEKTSGGFTPDVLAQLQAEGEAMPLDAVAALPESLP